MDTFKDRNSCARQGGYISGDWQTLMARGCVTEERFPCVSRHNLFVFVTSNPLGIMLIFLKKCKILQKLYTRSVTGRTTTCAVVIKYKSLLDIQN